MATTTEAVGVVTDQWLAAMADSSQALPSVRLPIADGLAEGIAG